MTFTVTHEHGLAACTSKIKLCKTVTEVPLAIRVACCEVGVDLD
jgi:hypothetical protein